MYTELYCDDCGAVHRNECHCRNQPPEPEREDRWVGADGCAYVGDKRFPSGAYHDTENCRCPLGAKHDPEQWY